jgi:hypothetical protein
MNIKLTTLCLGGFFALTSFVARPLLADEANKRTEFQFSGPVQIPGETLAAGKYIFQLADDGSDQNLVQIFSEDSAGQENLVATLMAIPDYIEKTPDKPIIHFEDRAAPSQALSDPSANSHACGSMNSCSFLRRGRPYPCHPAAARADGD